MLCRVERLVGPCHQQIGVHVFHQHFGGDTDAAPVLFGADQLGGGDAGQALARPILDHDLALRIAHEGRHDQMLHPPDGIGLRHLGWFRGPSHGRPLLLVDRRWTRRLLASSFAVARFSSRYERRGDKWSSR
jgi:hypothetical protein